MDIKLIVALIGLSGVAASAFIQFYLGRHSEKNKKFIETKSQAYLDFINIVSGISSLGSLGQQPSLDQQQKLSQAKSRTVLIGSEEVVKKIHKFFTKYGFLDSDESKNAFSDIVVAMRVDLSGEKSLQSDFIKESLFGKIKK